MKVAFPLLILVIGAVLARPAQEMEDAPNKDPEPEPRRDTALTVGLPFIFGMDLNRNRNREALQGNQTTLDLGVLGGLVRISMDRTRDANGTRGPIDIRIFGIPVTGRK